MIELHSMPTPNGQKVMIMLEETNTPYEHFLINIRKGDQFTPEYLKLSPNNKIPAMVDTDGPGGRYTMMESGAILIYLAEKTGQFLPADPRGRYDVLQWLMFQMGHVGPMFGQANHFLNYAPEDVPYGKERYRNETLRLYKVLDNRLAEFENVALDDYTIADMAIYPWAKLWETYGLDIDAHPNFKRWLDATAARPAVKKVLEESVKIREEMNKDNDPSINIFDTKQNAEMLAKATTGN